MLNETRIKQCKNILLSTLEQVECEQLKHDLEIKFALNDVMTKLLLEERGCKEIGNHKRVKIVVEGFPLNGKKWKAFDQ